VGVLVTRLLLSLGRPVIRQGIAEASVAYLQRQPLPGGSSLDPHAAHSVLLSEPSDTVQ